MKNFSRYKKFRVGDRVVEKNTGKIGVVEEANRDYMSSTGMFYLVNFGGIEGNMWSNGERFKKKGGLPK